MIARGVKYLAIAVLLILVAVFAAAFWITRTTAGARWALETAAQHVPGTLVAAGIDGSIAGGLELAEARYGSDVVDVEVRRLRLAVDPVLFPELKLNVRELIVEGAAVRLKEVVEDEPGAPLATILERLSLPFELNVGRLAVSELDVTGSDGAELVYVRSAELGGRWQEAIDFRRLQVTGRDGAVEGSVRLGLAPPHAADAALALSWDFALDEQTTQPVRLRLDAAGDLQNLRVDLDAAEPELRAAGFLRRLLERPAWELDVEAPRLQWPLGASPPQAYLREVLLETRGSVDGYSVSGVGSLAAAESGEHGFAVTLEGDLDGARVTELAIAGGMLEARARGAVRWSEPRAVQGEVGLARFDPSRLADFWPRAAPVSGAVNAEWREDRVELNEVRLRVPAIGSSLEGSGIIDLAAGVVDADLDWRALRWPLQATEGGEEMTLTSEFGRLRVSGNPDDWRFDGRVAFAAGELPQGVFQLAGSGTREGVSGTLAESEVLGGRARGVAAYRWSDGTWSARLATEDITLDPLLPDWPGRVSGRFATEGRVSPLRVQADVAELDGTVRGRPVNGSGGLEYAQGRLRADDLRLASGESRLRADGELYGPAGLAFDLRVDSLAEYYLELGGSVAGSGHVSLAGDFPRLRLDLQAEDLVFRDYILERLSVSSAGLDSDAPVAMTVKGDGLTAGDRSLESFTLVLAAAEDRQRLRAELNPAGQRLALELDGAFANWRRPLEAGWAGQLVSLALAADGETEFALERPAELRLAREHASLDGACLAGSDEARLCLDGAWSGGPRLNAALTLQELPVELLRLYRDTGISFTQKLNGHVSYRDAGDGRRSAEALIAISPGRMLNRIDERLSMDTGPGKIRIDLAENRLLTGTVALPLEGSSELGASFEVADIGMGRDSPLTAELSAQLADIGLVAELAPALDSTSGRLELAATLGGTLGDPDYSGRAALRDGRLIYAPLGLALSNLELEARADEDEGLRVRGTFDAGEGSGELRSRALPGQGPGTGIGLAVNGENLTVVDLPDINVVANLDLGLGYRDRQLTLNGGVLVPRARISPTNLTTDLVNASDDVVVVAGEELEPEEEGEDESPPVRIVGTVGVQLGQDVIVDLDIAEARLSGTAAYTWNGPAMPIANGQYGITGRIEAYAQVLDIAEGTIRFPGVPAANPHLRIRAEREIFGNPQIRNAGVLVTGTARNPEVEVYTNPATTEERALTLLITGSDFNYEQGVGAVDVGTYIAPDLYISYGIGLFERDNVISLRYDIGRGFGIKATSGRRAEGVDLSYTIQR